MIPPLAIPVGQRSANFSRTFRILFEVSRLSPIFRHETGALDMRFVSNSENRYPSPSMWPASSPRSRPHNAVSRRRTAAESVADIHISLAVPPRGTVSLSQERCALQCRGNRKCRKNFPSSPLRPSLACRHATVEATLNAPSLARLLAVRSAKFTRMANASPVRRWAVRRAHWRTTSDHTPLRAEKSIQELTRHAAGQLFFVAGPNLTVGGRALCSKKS